MLLPHVLDSVQLLSQPSQSTRLPSSHSSPGAFTAPSPQLPCVVAVVEDVVVVVVVGPVAHVPADDWRPHLATVVVFGLAGLVKSTQYESVEPIVSTTFAAIAGAPARLRVTGAPEAFSCLPKA